MADIVSRLKKSLGSGFFIDFSNERHEMVDIQRRGYFSNHPPKKELEALIKEVLPGINFEIKESDDGEEYFTGTGSDLRLFFTHPAPAEYFGHVIIFGDNSHVHLMLTRRGRYPTPEQQTAYVKLIHDVFRRFYQPSTHPESLIPPSR